jgi:hypothetical protein
MLLEAEDEHGSSAGWLIVVLPNSPNRSND